MGQTTGNTQFGGVKPGFRRSRYQSLAPQCAAEKGCRAYKRKEKTLPHNIWKG